ncbi:MAG: 50S ribosomal protein L19e [Nanoarchaeota archaeon]
MNLRKKKKLIARVLKIGMGRVILDKDMQEEIKEAITRQDIKQLKTEKIVRIKEGKGRKKQRRKGKRGMGSIKKKVGKRKKTYVAMIRKMRGYVKDLKERGQITREQHTKLRKRAKAREFRDLSHLREAIRK